MRRSNGIGTLFGLLFVVLLFIARPGCDIPRPVVDSDYYQPAGGTGADAQNGSNVQQVGNVSTVPSTVNIGSFNIQDFGPTKAGRPETMAILVDVVRKFDLLAIQELSDAQQKVIPEFIRQINADGSRFSYIVGPRQGVRYSTEQYVYLYDTAKFRLTSDPYVAPNPGNTMVRPPLVASFECTQAPTGQGFSFTMLNLHVAPKEVEREFAALESIVSEVMAHHRNEDDFLVVGDFNDSEKGIRRYRWLNNQFPLVRKTQATKVRSGRSIDNIVINGVNTAEFRNQAGVFNVSQQYELSQEQALRVSDHYPVWAVFSTLESQNRVATRQRNQAITN